MSAISIIPQNIDSISDNYTGYITLVNSLKSEDLKISFGKEHKISDDYFFSLGSNIANNKRLKANHAYLHFCDDFN
jgi:hypothetical protein